MTNQANQRKKIWVIIVFSAACGCLITLIGSGIMDYIKGNKEEKLRIEHQISENTQRIKLLEAKVKEDEIFKQKIYNALGDINVKDDNIISILNTMRWVTKTKK
jgi:hypothetical protein